MGGGGRREGANSQDYAYKSQVLKGKVVWTNCTALGRLLHKLVFEPTRSSQFLSMTLLT